MRKNTLLLFAACSVFCLAGCSSSSSKAVETTTRVETTAESISVSGADNSTSENMTIGRDQFQGLDDEKLTKISDLINDKTFEKGEKISLADTGLKECEEKTQDAFIVIMKRFADYDAEKCELTVKEKTEIKFTYTSEKISYSFKAYH